jgi:hypothetical protein
VQKVGQIGTLGWIPTIQPPFNSSCAAVQYETGTNLSHLAVSEIHAIENLKISVVVFSISYRVPDDINQRKGGTCQGNNLFSAKVLWRRHRHPDECFPSVVNNKESGRIRTERLVKFRMKCVSASGNMKR